MTEHHNHWHAPRITKSIPLSQRHKAHAKAHPKDKNTTIDKARRGEEE
jgi:hypothetical protein